MSYPMIGAGLRIPRINAQLAPDTPGGQVPATGPSDCNVVSTMLLCSWQSRGVVVPSRAQVRQIMGVPSGGTSTGNAIAVLDHFGIPFRKLADFAELEAALADPKQLVSVAVKYATVNTWPCLSGDHNFTGGHRMCVHGSEQVYASGPVFHHVEDPIADGRRLGIAKSPLMYRRGWLQQAMVDFGSFSALAVTR